MKVSKWYEKACAIFDKESARGTIATNVDGGFVFSNAEGTFALFIPGYSACSAVWERGEMARKSSTLRILHDKAMHDSLLAMESKTGTFADRKGKVREFKRGYVSVYVYEKLLQMFPKNALFYVSHPFAPVVVCLEENGTFYEVGMVMPMHSAEKFVEDAPKLTVNGVTNPVWH